MLDCTTLYWSSLSMCGSNLKNLAHIVGKIFALKVTETNYLQFAWLDFWLLNIETINISTCEYDFIILYVEEFRWEHENVGRKIQPKDV